MAPSMSSRLASAVKPSTCSVAGLTLSNVAPLLDSTSLPSMSSRVSPRGGRASVVTRFLRTSVEHGHRDVGVAGDVGHVHPAQRISVDLELGQPLTHQLERDLAFHAGERGAEAAVHSIAEADVLTLLTLDVERVRVLVDPFVAAPRPGDYAEPRSRRVRP